jgi:hypothetical protein
VGLSQPPRAISHLTCRTGLWDPTPAQLKSYFKFCLSGTPYRLISKSSSVDEPWFKDLAVDQRIRRACSWRRRPKASPTISGCSKIRPRREHHRGTAAVAHLIGSSIVAVPGAAGRRRRS